MIQCTHTHTPFLLHPSRRYGHWCGIDELTPVGLAPVAMLGGVSRPPRPSTRSGASVPPQRSSLNFMFLFFLNPLLFIFDGESFPKSAPSQSLPVEGTGMWVTGLR